MITIVTKVAVETVEAVGIHRVGHRGQVNEKGEGKKGREDRGPTVGFLDDQSYGIKESRDRAASGSGAPHTDVGGGEVVQQAGWVVIVDGCDGDVDDAPRAVKG